MNCKKCKREFKKNNSLKNHEKFCDGIGTKIEKKIRNTFKIWICPRCKFDIKNNRIKHLNSCDGNGPRRKRKSPFQGCGHTWSKNKTFEEIYGKEKSDLIKKKMSDKLKGKSTGMGHTPEIECSRRNKIRKSINVSCF